MQLVPQRCALCIVTQEFVAAALHVAAQSLWKVLGFVCCSIGLWPLVLECYDAGMIQPRQLSRVDLGATLIHVHRIQVGTSQVHWLLPLDPPEPSPAHLESCY